MSLNAQPTPTKDAPLHFRQGTPDDLIPTHRLLLDAVYDLAWRTGIRDSERTPTEEEYAEELQRWRPILEHLTRTADQFWVAERSGELVGFARSILRDDVRELTEFFVSPTAQSDGIGRELLARAMPPDARRTYIMATIDLRAQARYHKLGLYQVCAIYTFYQQLAQLSPPQEHIPASLDIVPITPQSIPMLAMLDQAIHGHRRDTDHDWLMAHRTGFILLRGERAAGYGYVGADFSGPFAMLDAADFPAALAHAEQIAFAKGYESFGVDVPMLNRTAIRYLLERGYRMSPFFCFYMCSDQPLHVDKTIVTSPMIMI